MEKTTKPVEVQRHSKAAHYLVRGTTVLGIAVRIKDGQWVMLDTKGNRLDEMVYGSPGEVAKCFNVAQALFPGKTD